MPEVRYPRSDEGLNSLEARKKSQLDSASQLKVFYKFHFTDELKQAGSPSTTTRFPMPQSTT